MLASNTNDALNDARASNSGEILARQTEPATRIWLYRSHGAVSLFLAAVTLISFLRLTFNIGYNNGAFEHTTMNHASCCIGFLESYLVPISVGLLVSALGTWLRRSVGVIFSLLALLWVGTVYLLWHLATLKIMRDVDIEDFSRLSGQRQYLLALNRATWWDLVVLAITISLFIWQIRMLITFLKKYKNQPASPASKM